VHRIEFICKFAFIFVSRVKEMLDWYINIGHGRFVAHCFRFINILPYTIVLCIP